MAVLTRRVVFVESRGVEGGVGDALPDGEDEVEGDGDAGGHVLVDESLVLELLQL